MSAIEPQIVYVDDSGSEPDPRVRLIVAAFCVSTEKKWKKFESAWNAVAQKAGFTHFHMTEFAGCRSNSWCRDCKNGKTDAGKHPWREWSNTKRKEVLGELVQTVCKYVEQGFGIAFTKEDIKRYVLDSDSALRAVARDQFGNEHFTFAATTCGGELARWRAKENSFPPVKFVFDLCTEKQKLEIAKAFIKADQVKPQFIDGIEQWFDVDAKAISFASRKDIVQLLSADMLAWVTAKIRALDEYPETAKRKGWPKDLSRVAFPFIDSKKLHIGYNTEQSVREWQEREITFWKDQTEPCE